MFTLADVDAYAKKLAGVTVGESWGRKTWLVNDRGFVWDRPLTKADIKRYGGAELPQGEILGVRVESLDAKDAMLGMGLSGFFTIEHFNGWPGLLIELRLADADDVRRAIMHAWTAMSAKKSKGTKRVVALTKPAAKKKAATKKPAVKAATKKPAAKAATKKRTATTPPTKKPAAKTAATQKATVKTSPTKKPTAKKNGTKK